VGDLVKLGVDVDAGLAGLKVARVVGLPLNLEGVADLRGAVGDGASRPDRIGA
jgi:hypothetical protein